jgi:uncharacterized protein YbjT (DUF2867 family)
MITIAGGTGQVGKPLTQALVGDGEQVRVLTRDPKAAHAATAARSALIARRPVLLDVPVDLLSANVEHIGSPPRPTPAHTTSPAEDALDHALGVIASARRPLVLGGRGAVLAEAARNCCSPTRWVHRSRQPFWHMTSSVANRSISACSERSRSRRRSKSWPNPTA